jgi:SAM-dependent methyltransferase
MKANSYTLKMLKSWLKGSDMVYSLYLKEGKVLDIGCGEGKLLKKDRARIFGVDINPSSVEKLVKEGLNAKLGDVSALPYENSFFDVVHSSNLIEHLSPEEARMMFMESKRVLKPGGRMILITPMPRTVWNTFGHIKPYPPAAIKKLFRKVSLESFESVSGLRIKEIVYYGAWALNKLTFLISTLFANLWPAIFAGSYLMVIEKE